MRACSGGPSRLMTALAAAFLALAACDSGAKPASTTTSDGRTSVPVTEVATDPGPRVGTTAPPVGGPSGSVRDVTAGGLHTCALLVDGTVKCWGSNDYGQVGDGKFPSATSDVMTPSTVVGIGNATAVTAGAVHSCALLSTREVMCWGSNVRGQLGDGTTDHAGIPVAVTGIDHASAVVAGGDHTCALLADATIACWGLNSTSQMGDGTTTNTSVPVPVAGVSGALSIAAGRGHTCASAPRRNRYLLGLEQTGPVGQWSRSRQGQRCPLGDTRRCDRDRRRHSDRGRGSACVCAPPFPDRLLLGVPQRRPTWGSRQRRGCRFVNAGHRRRPSSSDRRHGCRRRHLPCVRATSDRRRYVLGEGRRSP